MRAPLSGLTMNMCAVAGLRSAVSLGIACAAASSRCSAPASHSGLTDDLRAETVGGIFARAADRHLHQHGGKRREDHHRERPDDAHAAIVVVAIAAKEHAELRNHGDRTGDGRGNRHDQRVVIFDMRQLVRDHAGDFLAAEMLQQTGGHGDGGILRIASGGERVRLRVVHQVNARHRQAGALRTAREPD